jgi:hypothetical protein
VDVGNTWTFATRVFPWDEGPGPSWRFARLPIDVADEMRSVGGPARGFGSFRVQATVGDTSWRTSVFPETSTGSFLLPVKQAVRKAESIADGDVVNLSLTLV